MSIVYIIMVIGLLMFIGGIIWGCLRSTSSTTSPSLAFNSAISGCFILLLDIMFGFGLYGESINHYQTYTYKSNEYVILRGAYAVEYKVLNSTNSLYSEDYRAVKDPTTAQLLLVEPVTNSGYIKNSMAKLELRFP